QAAPAVTAAGQGHTRAPPSPSAGIVGRQLGGEAALADAADPRERDERRGRVPGEPAKLGKPRGAPPERGRGALRRGRWPAGTDGFRGVVGTSCAVDGRDELGSG